MWNDTVPKWWGHPDINPSSQLEVFQLLKGKYCLPTAGFWRLFKCLFRYMYLFRHFRWVWWCLLVISAVRMLRQEECMLKSNLGYIAKSKTSLNCKVRTCLKNMKSLYVDSLAGV